MICDNCNVKNCWLRGGLTLGSSCNNFLEKKSTTKTKKEVMIEKLDTLTKYPIPIDIVNKGTSNWLLDYEDVKKFIKDNI